MAAGKGDMKAGIQKAVIFAIGFSSYILFKNCQFYFRDFSGFNKTAEYTLLHITCPKQI